MLAQLERAVKKNEPIVFLGWEPHPMNINYEITYLSGGDVEFGPNFGGSTVHTISRPGYREDCPNGLTDQPPVTSDILEAFFVGIYQVHAEG